MEKGFSFFSSTTAIILIISFSLMMFFYIISSVFWKELQKDKYKGFQFTTKNIAYITMLITASVVTTIVVSIVLPITVWPPVRIAIEGIMIKITGYMFGPMVGIICATITDLLVMIYVPSYIHFVYIFCVIITGFIAGVVGLLRIKLYNHIWVIFVLINFFMVLFVMIGTYATVSGTSDYLELSNWLSIHKYAAAGIIVGGGIITLIIFYLLFFCFIFKEKSQLLKDLLPILLLTIFSEYMITVMLASYADISLIAPTIKDNYALTIILRVSMAPMKIFINAAVIYLTWKTISPLINAGSNNINQYQAAVLKINK